MKVLLPVCYVLATVFAIAPVSAKTSSSSATPNPASPVTDIHAGIAWYKGSADAAFAQARKGNKPVFLYWGAKWCPPCNQVKATLFNRRDFIELSHLFVPVYLDGDSPGAQKLGERFNVRGYPTMILFNAAGTEITRLPGEVDAAQYMRVLRTGLNAARPVKVLLASALGDSPQSNTALSSDDWRLLAFYSWDTDQQQLLATQSLPATLRRLAQICPTDLPAISARLLLKALALAAATDDATASPDRQVSEQLVKLLGDTRITREIFDLVTNSAGPVVDNFTFPDSDERAQLVAAWNTALDSLIADASLSTADRLNAFSAKITLAKLDSPEGALAEPLLLAARNQVERADRATTNVYARQSVISAAADVLSDAGLIDESDRLLKAELKRSHSPYYFMLGLAANAKKRGDKAAALDWSARAYAAAKGPATRLQWGVNLLRALIDLAPQDEVRIETVAQQILGELSPSADTFCERNRYSLEKMAGKLAAWNKENRHAAVLDRLRLQLAGLCKRLPAADPARSTCRSIFS